MHIWVIFYHFSKKSCNIDVLVTQIRPLNLPSKSQKTGYALEPDGAQMEIFAPKGVFLYALPNPN